MSIDPSTYKTGNASPSNSAEDLSDNARVFDVFMNDKSGDSVLDRLGMPIPTLSKALQGIGWVHVGEWSTNPEVTESNQVIPYAGTNQLFRPLSLPYQVDSAAHPNPNALIGTELVDVSKFQTEQEVIDLINELSSFRFGTVAEMLTGDVKDGESLTTVRYNSQIESCWLISDTEPTSGFYLNCANGKFAALTSSDGDLRHYGLYDDDTTDNTALMITACNAVKGTPVKLVAKGMYYFGSGDVNIYNDFDFSNATFRVADAKFNIADDRDGSQIRTFTESDFDKSKLTLLSKDFNGVFNDTSVVTDFAESMYIVNSSSVYIYRVLNGSSDPQNKCSVGILGKHGRLDYSLSTSFNDASDVEITLYKLHPKTLVGDCPTIVLDSTTKSYVFRSSRNNVIINNFSVPQISYQNVPLYSQLFQWGNCAKQVMNNPRTGGYGVTNNVSGLTSEIRYDMTFINCVGLEINNPQIPSGWKSIDGSNSRGITVTGGSIDSMHGHYNVADVDINGTKVTGKSVEFGTGAFDSVITLNDVDFSDWSFFSVGLRADYGELRGNLILNDCTINKKHFTSNFQIVSLYERAIYQSGTNQPGEYSLPSRVVISNLKVRALPDVEVNLIRMPEERKYSSTEKLSGPKEILIDGLNIVDSLKTSFRYDFIPYDYVTAVIPKITVQNTTTAGRENPLVIKLGKGAPDQNTIKYNANFINTDVSTNAHTGSYSMFGSRDSELRFTRCGIYRGLDTFAGSVRYLGMMEVESSYVEFVDALGLSETGMNGWLTKCINTVFDGTSYKANVGSIPVFNQTTHTSIGNVAIDANTTVNETPASGNFNSNGMQSMINKVGQQRNYTRQGDGTLLPS